MRIRWDWGGSDKVAVGIIKSEGDQDRWAGIEEEL
jgi:hypothetical protein